MRLTAGSSGKPLVRMFLSFARADEAIAVRLWEQLAIATAVDRVYEFELRRFDQALLVGSDWDACVRDALTSCELGVLALSDAFLGSVHSSIVAVLQCTSLRSANLHSTDLTGAYLRQCRMEDADLAGTITSGLRHIWSGASLPAPPRPARTRLQSHAGPATAGAV